MNFFSSGWWIYVWALLVAIGVSRYFYFIAKDDHEN